MTTFRAKTAIEDMETNDWSAKDGLLDQRKEQAQFWLVRAETPEEHDEIVVWVAEEWGGEYLPENPRYFQEGDIVTYASDPIDDSDEWGTVVDHQTDSTVQVIWKGHGNYVSREDAIELKLVKPVEGEVLLGSRENPDVLPSIVPDYITEKIEGHEDEGDNALSATGPHAHYGVDYAVAGEKEEPDMVNHPPHYNQHPKGIECIDVIEENPFPNLANTMKYVWRVSWGSKGNDIEDLEKAKWFLQREIWRRING